MAKPLEPAAPASDGPGDRPAEPLSTAEQQLVEALARRRWILTSTTGRSGTGFLAAALGLVPGMTSLHEPRPWLADAMRDAQGRPRTARRFLLEHKLPAVAQVETELYAESSHLYCKGFLEPLVELGIRPDLVILTRSPRQVALSMVRLETIPGRTEQGLRWYLSPADPGVLPLAGWHELTDYQLCYWYTREIARRSACYETRLRALGSRVVRIDLTELRTVTGFARLLRELELPRPKLYDWLRLAVNRYTRVNAKRPDTLNAVPVSDLEAQEREVEGRLQEAPPVVDPGDHASSPITR
ncbi:MAG: hypothetical protein KDD11_00235 [Acidobacteria bacterium]|nr:hypothetical protein [Acidobacteriota bacterium]